jgi:molybdopterin-guanine dinucleotide biosynthesis protein A
MGLAKATLPFGGEVMLQRVARLLGQVVDPLLVVAADGQSLPDLPAAIRVVRDGEPDQGPLEGIFAGLSAAADLADAAYITSCDVPLLVPAFVQRLLELLHDHQVVVPVEQSFHHPLAAVYRTDVLPQLAELRAAGRMRPVFLFDQVDTLRVAVDQLREVDPQLRTLANLNTPREYLEALAIAGIPPQQDILERL